MFHCSQNNFELPVSMKNKKKPSTFRWQILLLYFYKQVATIITQKYACCFGRALGRSVLKHCRRLRSVRNTDLHQYIYCCAAQMIFQTSGLIWEKIKLKKKKKSMLNAEHVLNKPYGDSSKQNEKIIVKRFIALGRLKIHMDISN